MSKQDGIRNAATRVRIPFKARKSRSKVVRKGKVTSKFILRDQGEVIPDRWGWRRSRNPDSPVNLNLRPGCSGTAF